MRVASTVKYSALVGTAMLLLGFVGGWLSAWYLPLPSSVAAQLGPGQGANIATPQELRSQFGVFWEVWNLVESEFYHRNPLDRTKMIRGAISGMLATLDDPYTLYQEPDLAAITNDHMQGSSGGIGAYLRVIDGRAFIDRPIKNSPAAKAGLQPNDEILAINNEDVEVMLQGLDTNQATIKLTARVRGPKGSVVTLRLKRGDSEPFDQDITRDEIVISSVNSQMLDDNIAYVQITDFKATTTDDFDAALKELLPQQPRSLILDLRNNPGGYLTNAQEVLGRMYNGVALYEENRDGSTKPLDTLAAPDDVRIFDMPIVVLVNGNSASASEIVAGALRDERPGTYLLGEKTFGKGSVQNIHALSDGSSARITIAQWLTPDKNIISKIGITPQFVVPYAEDQMVPCVANRRPADGQQQCGDNQLSAAITLLAKGQTPPTTAAKP